MFTPVPHAVAAAHLQCVRTWPQIAIIGDSVVCIGVDPFLVVALQAVLVAVFFGFRIVQRGKFNGKIALCGLKG